MKTITNIMRRNICLLLLVFLATTTTACGDDATNGLNTLFTFTNISAGDQCANGGVQVNTGIDTNQNSVLDATEITDTSTVCNGATGAGPDGANGADGADGADGATGTAGADGPDGIDGTDSYPTLSNQSVLEEDDPNCPYGGIQIDSGIDDGDPGGEAGNGFLEDEEIDNTAFVCDGVPGLIDEPIIRPDGPAGSFIVDASGGVSLAGAGVGSGSGSGSGAAPNDGGEVDISLSPGTAGGHVKIFDTGLADATFEWPTMDVFLGPNPLVVTTNTTLSMYCVDGPGDGTGTGSGTGYSAGDPYLGCYDPQNVYEYVDGTGDTLVSGIHVGTGVTLTIEPYEEMVHAYDTRAPIDLISLDLSHDLFNEGTITTSFRDEVLDRTGLSFDCDAFHGGLGSSIDLSGSSAGTGSDGSNGGRLRIETTAFHNQGSIDTSGGDGDNGGNGNDVTIDSRHHIYNTGDITTYGGDGANGRGGYGDDVTFDVDYGNIINSGVIDAAGGTGTEDGGNGAYVAFDIGYTGGGLTDTDTYVEALVSEIQVFEMGGYGGGDIYNSGDIYVAGGNAAPGCVDDCSAGRGGAIDFNVFGGGVTNSANLVADGGVGGFGMGGNGGQIVVSVSPSSAEHEMVTAERLVGDILLSGDFLVGGGDGALGGEGGDIEIYAQGGVHNRQEIVFLGYSGMTAAGGDGLENGGDGGDVSFSNPGEIGRRDRGLAGPPPGLGGAVVNYADIDVAGGNVTGTTCTGTCDGGDGGGTTFATELLVGHNVDFEVIVNFGDIDLSGGNGIDAGGDGAARFSFVAYHGIENHGDIDGSGGDASDPDGAGGDAFHEGPAAFYSELGSITNTGDLDFSGGNAEGANGHGGDGGQFGLVGIAIDNSGDVTVGGGNGGTTAGNGGNAGILTLISFDGVVNSGAFDVSGGTGFLEGDEGVINIERGSPGDWFLSIFGL